MTIPRPLAVVGVFSDQRDAEHAIQELRLAGFQDDQIGVAARHVTEPMTTDVRDLRHKPGETYAAEGAVTGMAAGAGLGALAGLAILAGMLPPIGPAIAGGTLAVILSTAAAGAAAVGIAGALAGMGVTHEEATFYESEFHAGRIVLAVTPNGRDDEARAIIKRFGGYDMSDQPQLVEPSSMGPVAMPMEPGVPANVNLAGEVIETPRATQVAVPVRSEQLMGDGGIPTSRSTVRVPVTPEEMEPRAHPRHGNETT